MHANAAGAQEGHHCRLSSWQGGQLGGEEGALSVRQQVVLRKRFDLPVFSVPKVHRHVLLVMAGIVSP